jgi:hypothetical protein
MVRDEGLRRWRFGIKDWGYGRDFALGLGLNVSRYLILGLGLG